VASEFKREDIEDAIVTLLTAQMPAAISIATVGTNDLTDDGELVFVPPCVRVLYQGDDARALESTRCNYDVDAMFAVMCADEDLRSKEAQRKASSALVSQVKRILAGARLILADGGKTEPVRYVKTDSLMGNNVVPVVYIPIFAVPGIAQFAGTNA
jgi:hypothetical protein